MCRCAREICFSISARDNLRSASKKLGTEGSAIVEALVRELETLEVKLSKSFDVKIQSLLKEFSESITEKNKVIESLKAESITLKKELSAMDSKLEDSEAYSRRDCLVISGPGTPTESPSEDCIPMVTELIKSKFAVNLAPLDVSCAHRFGPKGRSAQRSIVVKLVRRDMKTKIIKASRDLPKNVAGRIYAQESLTTSRNKIFYVLRKLRRSHSSIVRGCSVSEGSVFAYTKPEQGENRDKRHTLNSIENLREFCRKYVSEPRESFLVSSPAPAGM